MSSPIVFPVGLPRAFAEGHEFSPIDDCLTQRFDLGEVRRLPRYSKQPQIATARWRMTQAQYDLWRDFVEDTLLAGAKDFDLQLAPQGGSGLFWYTAALVEHEAAAVAGGRWAVSARLLLREEIGVVRPPLSIGGTGVMTLAGYGVPTLDTSSLRGSGDMTLAGAAVFSVIGAGDITLDGSGIIEGDAALSAAASQRVWTGMVWIGGMRSSDINASDEAVQRNWMEVGSRGIH